MFDENVEWKKVKKAIKYKGGGVDKLKSLRIKSFKKVLNNYGKNLLHVSIKHGKVNITEFLIESGCDVNQKCKKDGRTPLRRALSQKGRRMVALLLDSKVDISWTNIADPNSQSVHFGSEVVLKTFRSFLRKNYPKKEAAELLISKGWPLDGIVCLQDSDLTYHAMNSIPGLLQKFTVLGEAVKNTTEDEQLNLQRIEQLLKDIVQYKILIGYLLRQAVLVEAEKPTSLMIIKKLLSNGAPIQGFKGHHSSSLATAIADYNFRAAWILLDNGGRLNDEDLDYISRTWQSDTEFSPTQEENISSLNGLLLLMEHGGYHNIGESFKKYFSIALKEYFSHMSVESSSDAPFSCMPIIKWIARLNYFGVKNLRGLETELARQYQEKFKQNFTRSILKEYIKTCNEEISKMKKYKVDKIYVYDLFVKPIDDIVPYIRNNSIIEKLKSVLIVDNFNIYCDTLQFRIDRAYEKKF